MTGVQATELLALIASLYVFAMVERRWAGLRGSSSAPSAFVLRGSSSAPPSKRARARDSFFERGEPQSDRGGSRSLSARGSGVYRIAHVGTEVMLIAEPPPFVRAQRDR